MVYRGQEDMDDFTDQTCGPVTWSEIVEDVQLIGEMIHMMD